MAENAFLWSTTASSNDLADPAVPWPENMLPGQVNNSARSTMAAVARLLQDLNGSIATTGSANAYLVTSNSGHTTYTNGILITAKANFSNTGACSLNLNSYGAKAIRVMGVSGETDPTAGQVQSGGTYQFRYDSAAASAAGAFILLNPSPDPTSQATAGDVKIWTSNIVPAGWLFANGSAVSRTTYATLFAVVSTTFGAGDGSTTFNLPDLRGRAPFGGNSLGSTNTGLITVGGSGIEGNTVGSSGGAQNVTLTTTQIPSHTHSGTTGAGSAHSHGISITTGAGSAHSHIGTTDSGGVDHTHTFDMTTAGQFSAGSGVPGGHGTTTTSGASAYLHTHTFTTATESSHTHLVSGTSANESSHTHSFTTGSTGSDGAHTNMPPALIVYFIVKT